MRARRLLLFVVAFLAASGAAGAFAFWASTDSSNFAMATADALPQGATPTASVGNGAVVAVNFARATTTSGSDVISYVIKRYTSAVATTPTSSFVCSWPSAAALSCSESSVADGGWYYTDAPAVAGTLWVGAESARSGSVVVDTVAPAAPSVPDLTTATDSGSSSSDNVTNNNAPTFSGTAEAGSTVVLFDGTTAVGSGTATAGSYSITASTLADGVHAMNAKATDAAGNVSSASSSLSVVIDTVAPLVSTSVLAKASPSGYLVSAVTQGGTYNVYASITETGSGVFAESADVSLVTTGGAAVALTAGTYPQGGVTYGYKSATQTVKTPLAAAGYAYTLTSTDVAGNVRTAQSGFSVTVDNSAPSASDIQATNVGGGTAGKVETGDTVTFTYNEQIDPESIVAGWTGASTNVSLKLIDGGCAVLFCTDDSFEIWNAAGTAKLALGTVSFQASDYYGCAVLGLLCSTNPLVFTSSTMVQSGNAITVTVGTGSGARVGSSTTMVWTPSSSPIAFNAAGLSSSTAARSETGAGDKDF